LDRLRREHEKEPIATLERGTDFVVPLLSAADIDFADEALNTVFV